MESPFIAGVHPVVDPLVLEESDYSVAQLVQFGKSLRADVEDIAVQVGQQLAFAVGWNAVELGAGASALVVVGTFLLLYNAGHLLLRAWGLHIGLSRGLNVASALGNPVFRQGPQYIGSAAALVAGIALPVALERVVGPGRVFAGGIIGAALIGILLLARLRERAEGWRIALGVLAVFVLYSVLT